MLVKYSKSQTKYYLNFVYVYQLLCLLKRMPINKDYSLKIYSP